MKTEQKIEYIQAQITGLEDEIWRRDTNAKALTRAGLTDKAAENSLISAQSQRLIDAFCEQLKELTLIPKE